MIKYYLKLFTQKFLGTKLPRGFAHLKSPARLVGSPALQPIDGQCWVCWPLFQSMSFSCRKECIGKLGQVLHLSTKLKVGLWKKRCRNEKSDPGVTNVDLPLLSLLKAYWSFFPNMNQTYFFFWSSGSLHGFFLSKHISWSKWNEK